MTILVVCPIRKSAPRASVSALALRLGGANRQASTSGRVRDVAVGNEPFASVRHLIMFSIRYTYGMRIRELEKFRKKREGGNCFGDLRGKLNEHGCGK